MTLAPSVWPLPYGVTIRTDYSPDHNYAIPRSQTQCWPVQLNEYQQVNIAAIHNGWIGHQAWTLRAWLSPDPSGGNVLPSAYGVRQNVHLTYAGNTWDFYAVGLPPNLIQNANTAYVINPAQIYYFNIQNISNTDDGYYCRFTFTGAGTTLVI